MAELALRQIAMMSSHRRPTCPLRLLRRGSLSLHRAVPDLRPRCPTRRKRTMTAQGSLSVGVCNDRGEIAGTTQMVQYDVAYVRKMAALAESARTLPTVDEMEPALFQPTDIQQLDGETVLSATSYYGDEFKVRVSADPLPETPVLDETSTTAGETEPGPETEQSSTEDGSAGDCERSDDGTPGSAGSVGFWRHGVFVPRPRTPEELRAHRGGSGIRRTLRKQQRMETYFRGEWRPAWLLQYAQDRAKREAVQARDVQRDEAPWTPSAHDQGDNQWSQEEWDAWNTWQGWPAPHPGDEATPSSSSSTTSTMSSWDAWNTWQGWLALTPADGASSSSSSSTLLTTGSPTWTPSGASAMITSSSTTWPTFPPN